MPQTAVITGRIKVQFMGGFAKRIYCCLARSVGVFIGAQLNNIAHPVDMRSAALVKLDLVDPGLWFDLIHLHYSNLGFFLAAVGGHDQRKTKKAVAVSRHGLCCLI